MTPYSILSKVAEEQVRIFSERETGIERNIDFNRFLRSRMITVITGVRRCGKSTLLAQFSKRLENFYYLNLDDERLLSFTVEDFSTWLEICQSGYHSQNVLLDEVQNVKNWERFVRRISDNKFKVFLTGSNAHLLDSELSTHLTGRYLRLELFPFSFEETLRYRHITSRKESKLIPELNDYLLSGGFPEYHKYTDMEILKRVYDDILFRDIMLKQGIRNTRQFRELALFAVSNSAKEFSYHSAAKTLNFKSHTSVKNAIAFMEEAYLLFELYKFDYSLKKQYVSNKKQYCIDNGLRRAVSFTMSDDLGRLLENMIYIEFRRRANEVFYFREKGECDFIVRDKGKITGAYQVCYRLSSLTREPEGLVEVSEKTGVKSLTIVTMEEGDVMKYKGRKIQIVPAWQWLLGLSNNE